MIILHQRKEPFKKSKIEGISCREIDVSFAVGTAFDKLFTECRICKKFIKIKRIIFGFKSPNNYYTLGTYEFYNLRDVFESAEVMFKNKI